MPWLCEARHSRESGNLEAFATGRLGIGRAALDSWSPVGVGDELRGMMEAQWIPVFTGMTGGGEWWKAVKSDAVALQNPSFPRKRESRALCDRKAGIGRGALDSWCPVGVGDGLRGNDGGAVDSRFHGNDRWAGMTGGPEWRTAWLCGRWHSSDAVALRSLSFPRKRESRDLCDGKGGHWPGGPGFLVPDRGRGRAPGE